MKKIKSNLILFGILLLSLNLSAQAFNGVGDKKIQAGIAAFGHGSGLVGTFDYGFHEFLSVGVGTEIYLGDDDNGKGNDDKDQDNFFIYGRFNVHLGEMINMPSEMDLYPGVGLGVVGDDFGFNISLGYRYFFNENMGAFVELGNTGKLGLVFNL